MSKSTRLEQIDGYFHGIHFYVKPTPIAIRKVEKEVNEMMQEWYKENHPEVLDTYYSNNDIENADAEELKQIAEYFEKQFKWMEDVEFRSRYCKTMAEHAMDFDSQPPDDIWKRDDLEFSTIREAWDFFCGKRRIPQNGQS